MLVKTLDSITEGACRPLKVRFEQIVGSQPGPVVAFKLVSVLQYYMRTLGALMLSGETALCRLVDELLALAHGVRLRCGIMHV